MRILHVTDTFLPKVGGAEIAIDHLVRAMGALGVECAVLAQRWGDAGKEISRPYPLRRFSSPGSARWAGWWIARHIARVERELGRFDAFIGHHAFPPGYACVQYAARSGRHAIVHIRGGEIYYGSRFRKKPHAWRKLRGALGDAAAVVCLSGAMRELVYEIVGDARPPAWRQRVHCIPNGIDLAGLQADASASSLRNDPRFKSPFVLGLGRTIRRKGFHLLIDAFAKVDRADWKLVIAGDGRELETLRQQAGPLGERVIFTGLVEGADKRWLLQNCRFVAAPSLEESFPNVALESLACGKPVIGSSGNGFEEMIRPGENGLLAKVDDVPALTAALADFMGRNLERESAAALATAIQFDWKNVAGRYIELLQSVTAAKSPLPQPTN